MDQEWVPESELVGRRHTPLAVKLGFIGTGLVIGVVAAGTMTAGAAATKPSGASTSASEYGQGYGGPGFGDFGVGGGKAFGSGVSGTVKVVGASSVTIESGGVSKTYQVTSDSRVLKDGPAKLADVKVGDEVRFVTAANGTAIVVLFDGKGGPGFDHFRGDPQGRGPGGHALPKAG